jgi:hypothetical protein
LKDKRQILLRIAERRFRQRVKRRRKKQALRRKTHKQYLEFREQLGGDVSYEHLVKEWLPTNISFLIGCDKSDFHISKLRNSVPRNNGIFKVPKQFSIIDYPKESYRFIQQVTAALITQTYTDVKIDYSECERADLGAHVFLDIILKDIITFFKKCSQFQATTPKVREIGGININNEGLKKFLFSVGSPAIHTNKTIKFKDIIPYRLCIHDRETHTDPVKIMEQKDIDTTTLVDYVIDSLKTLNKKLTPDKLDDLCIVIGEILINAEEHSTTKNRFSIGYFHEINENGKHYGVFRLAIVNFGNTIYEKFKDPNCPNIDIVSKMKNLSSSYNTRNLFFQREFEEETLWTLYALQDGVTSVAPTKYKKRGHGSIQFIESFFNIKGRDKTVDDVSRLTVLSGNTNITFDGTYNITEKEVDGEQFKFMTFNKSGNIEDKPDPVFVKYVDNYFPGTIISAKILFNEDDLTNETQ